MEQKKIEENSLYRLKSKRKLKALLFLDDSEYIQEYKVYCTNKGKRLVEEPKGNTLRLQRRIYKFINNIKTPEYLFSSTKGKSHIDNAKFHKDQNYVVALDLSKFFPKCSKDYVKRFFVDKMQMSSINADLMATILTIDTSKIAKCSLVEMWYDNAEKKLKYPIPVNHIPTGSCISQKLAFLTYLDMFDEIDKLCTKNKIKMSVFVDDVVLSSNRRISQKVIKKIIFIFNKFGHEVNKEKIKFYFPCNAKRVTGVYIDKNRQLKAPSSQHFAIAQLKKELENENNSDIKKLNAILGKMRYVKFLEGNKFQQLIKHYEEISETSRFSNKNADI